MSVHRITYLTTDSERIDRRTWTGTGDEWVCERWWWRWRWRCGGAQGGGGSQLARRSVGRSTRLLSVQFAGTVRAGRSVPCDPSAPVSSTVTRRTVHCCHSIVAVIVVPEYCCDSVVGWITSWRISLLQGESVDAASFHFGSWPFRFGFTFLILHYVHTALLTWFMLIKGILWPILIINTS